MKKLVQLLFSAVLFSLVATVASAQTNLYVNPAFDDIARDHDKIAIIPFKTDIQLRPKQREKVTDEDLYDMEMNESLGLQEGMYSWFLKRKKRGKLRIEVQEPRRTNAILSEQGIDYDNIENQLPENLAEILGVDAVIMGTFSTDKPMSEGASVALGVLFGAWGSTNGAEVNMSVNNGTDGELLWNYNKRITGSYGSTPEDLINVLMRKASRRLAYTKSENH